MYKEDLELYNLQCFIYNKKPTKSNYIYLIYMYKDLALNNLQCLICYKTQPNQPNVIGLLGTVPQRIINNAREIWYKRKNFNDINFIAV